MAASHQPIEVEIFGQTFTLRSEKSAVAMRQIAAYVDQRMCALAEQSRTAIRLRIAIMAALTIADEYHSATGQLGLGTRHSG
jgi:cell division protein ZapA (FtsZ GTPase activity inhibitor)